MALSGHGGVRKYKDFEKLFSEIVFTPDECNIVRNSLQKDGVEKKTRENIISCLSSISGILMQYRQAILFLPGLIVTQGFVL